MKGISIVICCYNSAQRLPETLKHIALQKGHDDFPVQVVLVNNNSTDDTVETANREWRQYNTRISLAIVEEPTPGLTPAREKGFRSALYDYILFCDDDNWLCDTYLRTAFSLMEARPDIGALGGQSDAASDIPFPEWWDEFKFGYAVGKQHDTGGDISSRKFVWGAGLVTRKELLEKVFDPKHPLLLSDRKGKSLTSGGDTEICERILLLGYKLYYDTDLCFTHYVPPQRLDLDYKNRIFEGFSESYPIIEAYGFVIDTRAWPRQRRLTFAFKMGVKALFFLPLGMFREEKTMLHNTLAVLLSTPRITGNAALRAAIRFAKDNN